MNQMKQASLEILKEIMNHIPADVPQDLDWRALYRELKGQSLLPLTYAWIKKREIADKQLNHKWMNAMYYQISDWHNKMYQQDKLIRLFEDNGYTLAVMKGNAVGALYPTPELRSSSDIDFLVRWEEYDQLFRFMRAHGYQLLGEKKDSKHHVALHKDKVVFEMHKRPGGTRINGTASQKELVTYFQKKLDYVEHISIKKYRVPVLDPVSTGLMLLLHTAAHMKTGIGLRHLLDWMVYANCYVTDEFWEKKLGPVARKAEVDQLAKTMTCIAQMYLGLNKEISWCEGVPKEICDQLLDYFWDQGDLGYKAGTEERDIEFYEECTSLKKFFLRLDTSSRYTMPIANKYVVLRPVAWMYQMIRYVRKGLAKKNPLATYLGNKSVAKGRRKMFEDLGLKWM